MKIQDNDRRVLRDLAMKVREIAARPEQEARRRAWVEHNALRSKRPLVLCFPEGAWLDCIPEASLQAQDPLLRGWETRLRMALHTAESLKDDQPIDAVFNVPWLETATGWGDLRGKTTVPDNSAERRVYYLHPYHDMTLRSHSALGAYHMEPPLAERSDLAKLRRNVISVDAEASASQFETAQELFDGLLEVRRRFNGWHTMGGSIATAVRFRGIQNLMLDMCDAPEFVHELMALVTDTFLANMRGFEAAGRLALNNGCEWVATGGIGYSDELPAPGFDPAHVRLIDLWGGNEAQDLVGISGEMFEEFFLPYAKAVASLYGLSHFGCCEPINHWLPQLKQIPNLRRVSISPWADIPKCAAGLGGRYLSSYKPHPSALSGTAVDWALLRKHMVDDLGVMKAHGCVVEIIMKDLHTIEHDPSRLDRWVETARAAINEVYL